MNTVRTSDQDLDMADDKKVIHHMRNQFSRVAKKYEEMKALLIAKKRQNVIRTLSQKLHKCKKHLHLMQTQNVMIQRRNKVLLREKKKLTTKIISMENTNKELQEFITKHMVNDIDLNDAFNEEWDDVQHPTSPSKPSSQSVMETPEKHKRNQRVNKESTCVRSLQFKQNSINATKTREKRTRSSKTSMNNGIPIKKNK